MELIQLILIFVVGFGASFIGSIVGGGGLVTIPLLIFIGLPPQIAVATNKFGSIGMSSGAMSAFWRARKIQWNYVIPFSILSVVGASVGANILVNIDDAILEKAIGIIILALVPLFFLKKHLGVQRGNPGWRKKTAGYLLYGLVAIWGGFFGGGSGIMILTVITIFFGMPLINANATNKIPFLLASLTAVFIFAINGIIDLWIGAVLLVSMYLGGMVGATTAVKRGNKWVKGLFILVIVVSAIKLLFF
ncbi:MAG: sulfite exporter TauE/SafE family protein [Nanoarchaeota archaeon]